MELNVLVLSKQGQAIFSYVSTLQFAMGSTVDGTSVTMSSSLGNMALVSRLLLDAGLTADLVKLWKEQTL